MAAFVRLAARQRAAEAVQREQQLVLSQRDFTAFHAAIAQPFAANAELAAMMADALTHARARPPCLKSSCSIPHAITARTSPVVSRRSIVSFNSRRTRTCVAA